MEAFQHAKETTAVNLGALLDPCDDAVVTLVAGETRLVAHRAVLVDRSPVFAAMFRHDTLESRSGQVTIVDVEGPVLRQLLSYLYTLQAPQLPDLDMITQLLVAADKYGVDNLKAACEQQVAAQLSVETAAATAVLALRYSCKKLRKASITFLKDNTRQVMASRGWEDVMRSHPDDLMEVNRLLAAKTRRLTAKKKRRRFREAAMEGAVDELTAQLAAGADVAAMDGGCENSSTMQAIQNAKETTAVDLGALLDACDDAMVTLVAGDTRLVAHRAVLMDRSPVFDAMFRHDTLESRSGQVTIVDVEGPVLRQLVSYLYTLWLACYQASLPQLLAAADKYGVAGLKAVWEQQVAAELFVETAVAAALLALRYSCERLRQASITFLKDYTRHVMSSRGWVDAMRSQRDKLMEVIRLLVAEFRSLPAEEKGRRLIQAAREGAVGELEALLAAGAGVAAVDEYMFTALHWAAYRGHVEVARRLLARGAPVDARNNSKRTPLHLAAVWGDVAVARLLLAASADHSARDSLGRTPLHYAAINGRAEAAAVLLEAGASRWARDIWGMSPLHLARQQVVDILTQNVAVWQLAHHYLL